MKTFTKLTLLSAAFIGTALNAAKLKQTTYISEADANYCGDINFIAAYDIEDGFELGKGVTAEDMDAIRAEIDDIIKLSWGEPQPQPLIIKNAWNSAANMLIDDLLGDGKTYFEQGEELTTSSCNSVETAKYFNITRGEDGSWSPNFDVGRNYYTLGILRGFNASEYNIHMYLDAKKRKLALFLIW